MISIKMLGTPGHLVSGGTARVSVGVEQRFGFCGVNAPLAHNIVATYRPDCPGSAEHLP